MDSVIDLTEITFGIKKLKLKSYFPSFVEEIKLKNHKILIDYNKNKLNIKGKGSILLRR